MEKKRNPRKPRPKPALPLKNQKDTLPVLEHIEFGPVSDFSKSTLQQFKIPVPPTSECALQQGKIAKSDHGEDVIQEISQHVVKPFRTDMDSAQLDALISERYDRMACFDRGPYEWPTRYCFISEGEKPPQLLDYILVGKFHDTSANAQYTVPSSYKHTWLNLSLDAKNKLYLYLKTFLTVGSLIVFDNEEECWIDRPSDFEDFAPLVEIKYYGAYSGKYDVYKTLACGRTGEEMKEVLIPLIRMRDSSQLLSDVWKLAFQRDLTNGTGRRAIEKTLDYITALALGLGCTLPLYQLKSVSSTANDDAFTLSHSGSSDIQQRSGSSSSLSSPDHKPNKYGSNLRDQNPAKRPRLDSPSCAKRKLFVDGAVVCQDPKTGTGKYIFLIEIYSHGNTKMCSQGKFIQELIYVLQGQSEVFGLYFSSTNVMIYRATKKHSQKIKITYRDYWLTQSPEALSTFSVSVFQKFWMDVFSCFLYGLEEIEC